METRSHPKARKPTLYFVGITATASSIMRIFPRWAALLGLGDCALVGIDLERHAEPSAYRALLAHIRNDERVLGATITSHKVAAHGASFEALARIAQELRT